MNEPYIETIYDYDYPLFTIVITTPDNAWVQRDTGQPGHIEFAVYPTIGMGGVTGESPRIMYERTAAISSLDYTHDLVEAAPVATGTVKWDGCVNWDMDGNGAMLHHCGVDGIENLMRAVVHAYNLCWERVGASWDNEEK